MQGGLADRGADDPASTQPQRDRRPRPQWALSALFLTFFTLKVAEGWLGLEAWPLTDVSMFLDRRPANVVPKRARLFGVREGMTVELTAADLRLSEDEFLTILRDDEDLGAACSTLVQSFNRRVTRLGATRMRITAAFAEREEIPRPGIPRPPWRIRAECAVDAPPLPPGPG
jgi:hypothetical protein